jgi:hypothetical protein
VGVACSSCRRRTPSDARASGLVGPFRRQIVHAYFHDTDLLDRRRYAALRTALAFLGMKRRPST